MRGRSVWEEFSAGLWEEPGPVFEAARRDTVGRLSASAAREPSTGALIVILFLAALAWGTTTGKR